MTPRSAGLGPDRFLPKKCHSSDRKLDTCRYGAAKTVADCFKFRNRLGIEVAVEALRTALEERKFTPAEVLRMAKICRVDRIVRPYLEALQ